MGGTYDGANNRHGKEIAYYESSNKGDWQDNKRHGKEISYLEKIYESD